MDILWWENLTRATAPATTIPKAETSMWPAAPAKAIGELVPVGEVTTPVEAVGAATPLGEATPPGLDAVMPEDSPAEEPVGAA